MMLRLLHLEGLGLLGHRAYLLCGHVKIVAGLIKHAVIFYEDIYFLQTFF
jgi:hypothetical protein